MSQTDPGPHGANTPLATSGNNAPRGASASASAMGVSAATTPLTPGGAPGNAPGSASGGAPRPKLAVPRTVVCPVSGTVFNPRQTGGKCPVCGEQVVPAELVAQSSVGGKLAGARTFSWLGKDGNWRIVALIALVAYQLGLFAWVWAELAAKHAF